MGTRLRPWGDHNSPMGEAPTWIVIPLAMVSAKVTSLLCCKSCPDPGEIANKHVLPKTLKENVGENENLREESQHRHSGNSAVQFLQRSERQEVLLSRQCWLPRRGPGRNVDGGASNPLRDRDMKEKLRGRMGDTATMSPGYFCSQGHVLKTYFNKLQMLQRIF